MINRLYIKDDFIKNNIRRYKMKGTVKWFNSQKGYGFITGEDGNEIFAHHSQINVTGFKTLYEGQDVTYDGGEGKKGPQAENITVI
jgi:CspA family cold shock protein